MKIGVHLPKLWPKNKVAVFFGTLCSTSSSSTSRSSLVCYNFNWFRQVLADNSSWLLAYYTLIQWFICNNYWHCALLIKHWTVTQNVYAKCHIIISKVFILTFFKLWTDLHGDILTRSTPRWSKSFENSSQNSLHVHSTGYSSWNRTNKLPIRLKYLMCQNWNWKLLKSSCFLSSAMKYMTRHTFKFQCTCFSAIVALVAVWCKFAVFVQPRKQLGQTSAWTTKSTTQQLILFGILSWRYATLSELYHMTTLSTQLSEVENYSWKFLQLNWYKPQSRFARLWLDLQCTKARSRCAPAVEKGPIRREHLLRKPPLDAQRPLRPVHGV